MGNSMYNKEEHFIVQGIENRGKRQVRVGSFYCILNNKTYTTFGGLRNAIRPFGYTMHSLYIKYYEKCGEGNCKLCSINKTTFADVVKGYKDYCSDVCAMKSDAHRASVSNRFVGDEQKKLNAMSKTRAKKELHSDEFKQDIRNRTRATLKINDPDGSKKIARGYSAWEKLQEMYKNNPEKKAESYRKNLETRRVNGTLGSHMSGRVYTIEIHNKEYKFQGYEDLLLTYLIENKIHFLHGNEIESIYYEGAVSKKYKPDFYLPYYNLLIDVKSERTIQLKPDKLLGKQNACYDAGFNFIYFVIKGKITKKNRTMLESDIKALNDFLNMPISSQANDGDISGRFNDYPRNRSTLQAIGSGNAVNLVN